MQDWIKELKSRADLISVISSYVPLKRSGKDFKARCPFHSEKTPSFTASQGKQLFYCFGCHAGGDVIKFVELIEKVDTAEAMRRLADKVGYQIPRREHREDGRLGRLREAVLEAAKFYRAELETAAGSAAREYLKGRSIGAEMIARYGIGYAPAGNELLAHLRAAGFDDKMLLEAGIAAQSEDGRVYARMRERIVFPILRGRQVLGFSARVYKPGDERPKYLNTPDTPLFQKGELLYGETWAQNMFSPSKPAYLVEGQLDVLQMLEAGHPAVAPLGTALTDAQAKRLARYGSHVRVVFDADAAGRRAAVRAARLLLLQEARVSVVALPDGADPADMAQRGETARLSEILEREQDVFAYVVDSIRSRHPDDAWGKQAALNEIVEWAQGLHPAHVQAVREKAAPAFGLPDAELARIFRSGRVPAPPAAHRPEPGEEQLPGGPGAKLEWSVLHLLLHTPSLWRAALAEIREEHFAQSESRRVWELMQMQIEQEEELDEPGLLEALAGQPDIQRALNRLLVKSPQTPGEPTPEQFRALLGRLRLNRLKSEHGELQMRLKAAESRGDAGEQQKILESIKENHERREAHEKLMLGGAR